MNRQVYTYTTPWGPVKYTCFPHEWNDIQAWLKMYFAGETNTPAPPIQLTGTPFQLKVWQLLQHIPVGEVRTYGELAQAVAPNMAAQAIGHALHVNPIPILIPCHRIIKSNGELGGYAYGTDLKRHLLEWEHAL